MAWKTPSRKEVAEQLGGQQVTRGRRVPRRTPGAKRTPEGPGGRRVIRMVPNSEWPERRQAAMDCADQSGAGVAEWAGRAVACVKRCWMRRGAAGCRGRCGHGCRARSDGADSDAEHCQFVPWPSSLVDSSAPTTYSPAPCSSTSSQGGVSLPPRSASKRWPPAAAPPSLRDGAYGNGRR